MSTKTQLTAVHHDLPDTPSQQPIARDLVKEIAMDIGKAVAHHIETMYPAAVESTTPNMLISVRNTVFNEIMAALNATDEDEIRRWLDQRKKHRKKMKASWKYCREMRDE